MTGSKLSKIRRSMRLSRYQLGVLMKLTGKRENIVREVRELERTRGDLPVTIEARVRDALEPKFP